MRCPGVRRFVSAHPGNARRGRAGARPLWRTHKDAAPSGAAAFRFRSTAARHRNGATGHSYSGINVLVLWGAVFEHGFPSQAWLSYKQAAQLGGPVLRGERGTTVFYADNFVPKDERNPDQLRRTPLPSRQRKRY